MAEVRHACEDGLTPACFAAHPQYAKKVFAYRLMHTLCPARMTKKLREALWRALTRVPISWIPFEYFNFPDDFDWSLIFPEGWMPGDELPDGVIVDPDAEFPEGWTPGDPLPAGVTIDLPYFLPTYWETADPLPFGITVDPEYRIQIPQLKLMYIFIRPGETWESVFPKGWDPTGSLPDGASWNPYLVFPGYSPAGDPSVAPLTPEQKAAAFASAYGTYQPLYLGPWEPGPVHRVTSAPRKLIKIHLPETDWRYSYRCVSGESWLDTRNNPDATLTLLRAVNSYIGLAEKTSGGTCAIGRGVHKFAIPFLPGGASFKTGVLYFSRYSAWNLNVVAQATTITDITLMSNFSKMTGAATPVTSWTVARPMFTLNDDIINYINANKGGDIYLMTRENDYDYMNVEPALGVQRIGNYYLPNGSATNPDLVLWY